MAKMIGMSGTFVFAKTGLHFTFQSTQTVFERGIGRLFEKF
uniref:Uncharacterized protein n=1 Tax=Pithovirus LCDPAC01 TaxID=2506600 RepID=A0A481YMJ3_9VIRU|nr:MAG: hypothetical protein LCDPAC01_00400 [Pithovirus LCDPAC01]